MVNVSTRTPDQPLVRPSTVELNRLLATLEVKVVRLTECLVSKGWRLEVTGPDAPGIHYNLMGEGWLVFEPDDQTVGTTRRLPNLPSDWETCSDDRLRQYFEQASAARRRSA